MRLTSVSPLVTRPHTTSKTNTTLGDVHFGQRPRLPQQIASPSTGKAFALVALGTLFGNLTAPWLSLPSRFIEPTNFQTLDSSNAKHQDVQNLRTGEVLKDTIPDWSATIDSYQVILNKIQMGKVKEVHYVHVNAEHQAANPGDRNGFTVTLLNGAELFLPPNAAQPEADQTFVNQLAALKDQGYAFASTGLLTHP